MEEYNIEDSLISCILLNNDLINELYISEDFFTKDINKRMITFFKKHYANFGNLDLTHMVNCLPSNESKNKLIEYCTEK